MEEIFPDSTMNHGVDQPVFHHGTHLDDSDMMMDETDYGGFQMHYPEEDELAEGMIPPRAVHQCNVCNKIFVSFKGLQQHAVIHTDQKPYQCDICAKSFRFKSNLFEHRSVHTGFTPHACPYCGKTCRLKGNLKKHLRTHVTTKEELEAAWRPFASNRRPPADIPDDAIIVRGTGGTYFPQPSRPRKKKLGLGVDSRYWVERIKRGDILPSMNIVDKVQRLEENVFNNITTSSTRALFEIAKSISFESYDCPLCKAVFMTRNDCLTHFTMEHTANQGDLEFFCEKCCRPFVDQQSLEQHQSYHVRVFNMLESESISRGNPQILVPTPEDLSLMFGETIIRPDQSNHGMIDNMNAHQMS
ncbi:unnamed protein product [Caenorhabditis angaria]|uniref:C2H2-type domain-containing protein n=1 Tax=Caenorhabditis angaria TaxID=860376 RepID=A0A9P1N8W4_9PELO|nr:unnamed protein product [Caenorhabditis angaria]